MKIAQVAPLYESVPPRLYGGTERVVSYLTEELVRRSHAVTLFAAGDSLTNARLIPGCERALRLNGGHIADPTLHHIRMLEEVRRRAHEFDVLHFHIDYLHFPLVRRLNIPSVTTWHGRLDNPDLRLLAEEFWDMNIVSISDAQRTPLPLVNWKGTVYHGLPESLYHYGAGNGGYLAFLGRISPEKRVDRAIELAGRTGLPLRIAAKVDDVDLEYFRTVIRPLLDKGFVDFIDEIGDQEKNEFLGNAKALLFPIDWPEPFGLVMIEALACGTPVIAFRGGSVPEVLEPGRTGFIVQSIEEAISAVGRLGELDRRACRKVLEERFTARRMAENYLQVYATLQAAIEAEQGGESFSAAA
jgi:glycosyltransferase involved in cell wall biosynthesis